MAESGNAVGALDHVRVLDLTSGVAGAIASMMLADFGAQVIRIEPPHDREPTGAPMWHRNKKVVTGAHSSADISLLARDADIVVTSCAEPWADAGAIGSRAVDLHVPPYLCDDRLDPLTVDSMAAAASGVARRQVSFSGWPVDYVYPFLSYLQGMWAAACAVAALIERERSGLGQSVTVDAMHGALVAATAHLVVDPQGVAAATAVGPGGPNPAFSSYRCADGQWIFLAALSQKFQVISFEVLGVQDVLDDPRIAGNGERLYAPENRDWVRERVAARFATRPRDGWLDLLIAADCPASAVESRDTWLDHPQVIALGQRRIVADPITGETVMPWVPVQLTRTPARTPVPRRYVEHAGWASTIGATTAQPSSDTAGGPLHGIRVLDLGMVLAGPYAGMLLAELGADVIKIEPPTGDPFRLRSFPHNRGQRSLAVNLRDPDGLAAFRTLAQTADVVIDNFRPGVVKRLGVDHDQLATINDDIITASITGFGEVGPLDDRPGFDPVLQAMSGMTVAQGGDSPPVSYTIAVNDVAAACAAAFGVCVAVFSRMRGGDGQHVSSSLAAVAAFMQCGELVRFTGRSAAPLGGADHPGPTALSRYYRTADGFVRVHSSSVDALIASGLVDSLPSGVDAEQAETIAAAIALLPTAFVVARLAAQGVIAVPARTFADLADDPGMLTEKYLTPVEWPDGRITFLPHRYARFSRTESTTVLIPPGLGEHSRSVLAEAGLEPTVIASLLDSSAIAEQGAIASVADVGYR